MSTSIKTKIHNKLRELNSKFLTTFGNIRYSKYPPFLFYDDVDFAVNGDIISKISKTVKNGDVLLRGYDSYVDTYFIKSSRKYSHAGIYVGKGQVIHATAPTVTEDHIIDFCHCDRIAILRPSNGAKNAVATAKKFLDNQIDYDFTFSEKGSGKDSLYCFELAAYCYQTLDLKKMTATALFGLLRKKEKIYLADSFLESPDFELVYEFNPKFGIT